MTVPHHSLHHGPRHSRPHRLTGRAGTARAAGITLRGVWLLLPLLLFMVPGEAPAGTQEIFYPNKTLKARVHTRTAEDGKVVRHGGFQRFHANGRRAVEGRYVNGRPVGLWSWWDQQGRLLRRVRRDGDFEELLLGREFNSPKTTFRNTAKRKISEGQLKFDKGHGPWTYFFHDGTPQAEGSFLTGIPDGRWILLYPDGQFQSIQDYRVGIPHGLFLKAYPNGQEEVEGRMDLGLRVGLWRFWYPNGRKKTEGGFLNDQEEGEWRYWDENGKLVKRLAFRQGNFIEELPIPKKRVRIVTEVVPNPMRQFITPPRVFDENGREITPQD